MNHPNPVAIPQTNQRAEPDTVILAGLIADGRLGSDIGITCRGKTDGAGAQAMATISAMAIARYVGCRYLHSPFTSMGHPEGTREDWARRWEAFLNLGDGETAVPTDAELVRLPDVVRSPDAYAGRPIVICERMFNLPDRSAARIRAALAAGLREKYWRSPKTAIPSHRATSGMTAAFHVRRGDIAAKRTGKRYVSDDAVLRQIARLRQAIAPFGRPLTINLYSEGVAADFRAFADLGCNLHVSEDPFETFHNMVTADILVTAPSTFSFLAGILSRGVVLDHRARASNFGGWVMRRQDGNISIKRLRRALLDRMGRWERLRYRVRRRWRKVI